MEESPRDLVHDKDENCKHIQALQGSVLRVLPCPIIKCLVDLLDYSHLFVTGLDEIHTKDELLLHIQQYMAQTAKVFVLLFFEFGEGGKNTHAGISIMVNIHAVHYCVPV